MKRNLRMLVSLLALVAIGLSVTQSVGAHLSAQVSETSAPPAIISYQGQVTVNSSLYTGAAYFKFAILDGGGNVYWSNDGTMGLDAVPSASVPLSVTAGLFTVLLGDTSVPGMTADLGANPSTFADQGRFLRVWFSTDKATFQLLSPDRRITSAPYALQAQLAANALKLSGYPATAFSFAGHQHSGADITSGAVAEPYIDPLIARADLVFPTVLANDGAGSGLNGDLLDGQEGSFYQNASNLNAGTVSLARLSWFTSTVGSLLPPYSAGAGITISAHYTIAVANGGVTNAMLANNSVTAAKVDSSQVQLRVSDSCALGSTIQRINADGTVVCAPRDALPVYASTSVDTAGDYGSHASIAIGADGLALISHWQRNTALRVTHCNDSACTSATTTAVDTGNTGLYSSVAIGADGFGLISYYDVANGNLKVAHCQNAACTSFATSTVDASGNIVGLHNSIAIGIDGMAVISYYDASYGDLKVGHCVDVACSSFSPNPVVVDGDGTGVANVGQYTSIAIGIDGYPLISYHDAASGDLKVAHCGDGFCTTASQISRPISGNDTGHFTSLTIGTDGYGLISAWSYGIGTLWAVHCTNVGCTSSSSYSLDDGMGYDYRDRATSITIAPDGYGLISYYDWADSPNLRVAHCQNLNCSSAALATLFSTNTTDIADTLPAITIGTDGLPLIATYDHGSLDLRAIHCSNIFCVPYARRR